MGRKGSHTTVQKELGTSAPVVQPTFPGQGGLSVGKDLNIQVSYSVCIFEGNFRAWMSFFLRHPTEKHSKLLCAVVSSF